MKREMKIDNYKRIYNELQNDSDVKGLGYPETKENLDFYGEIGKFKFDYSLMFEKDLLKIRAERSCPGTSDDVLFRFARQMGEEEKTISPTAYEGKVILSTFYPFPGIETEVASENIYRTAKKFFDFLKHAEEQAKKFDKNIPKQNEAVKTAATQYAAEKSEITNTKDEPLIETEPIIMEDISANPQTEPITPVKENAVPEINPVSDTNFEMPDENLMDVIVDFEGDSTKQQPKKEKRTKQVKKESHNKEPEVERIKMPYQPAPEVEKQMEDMYASLNKTMQMKKEQLDLRENILNKKSLALDKEQQKLNKEKSTVSEERKLLDNEREDLNKSWQLYHESTELLHQEKETLEANTKEVREKENSLRRREQSLNDKARNLDAKITGTNKKADSLAELEKDLTIREEEVSERNKSLLSREQQVDLKQKQVNFLMEQVNVEKEVIESRTKDLKNLEQMLKEMEKTVMPVDEVRYQEEIESLKSEKEEIQEKLHDAKTHISDLQKTIASLRTEINSMKQKFAVSQNENSEVTQLKEKLSFANKQIETLRNIPKANPQEVEGLKSELTFAQNSVSELKTSLEEQKNELESLQNEHEQLKEKHEKLQKETKPDAEALIAILQGEGIRMERVAGEAVGMITGELEGCKLIIDTVQGVTCVQKPCKRNHAKELEKWTSENICECFYQSKGVAYGRKYSSKLEDIKAMAKRLSLLK